MFSPIVVEFGARTVHIAGIVADEVDLVEHCVVRAEELVALAKQAVVVHL